MASNTVERRMESILVNGENETGFSVERRVYSDFGFGLVESSEELCLRWRNVQSLYTLELWSV